MTSSIDQCSSLPAVKLELEGSDGAGNNIDVGAVSVVIDKDPNAMKLGVIREGGGEGSDEDNSDEGSDVNAKGIRTVI